MQERLPFDPARVRGPRPPQSTAPAAPGPLTVSQVNELVRGAIAAHVPPTIAVLGEIGDFSRASSGHVYFTLKDPRAELRCVMWRSSAVRLRFKLDTGLQVIASGALEVYVPRGTYQLIVRSLEPRGVGALELAFRQLREKLAAEGLFDAARKRPLPRIPRRIAVVTSPRGAAIRDILTTLRRRYPAVDVLVFPVRVQGEGAAAEIAAAIDTISVRAGDLGGIDLMIVGRGGGSLEDLWAFNEEVVARAIAASRIPVVSAVGHEVDFTISDFVADLRAPTPTAAAELTTPSAADLTTHIVRQTGRVERALRGTLALARARLDALFASPPLARPTLAVRECAQRVDELEQRLVLAWRAAAEAIRNRLTTAALVLHRYAAGAHFARAARHVDALLARGLARLGALLLGDERRLAARVAALDRASPGNALSRDQARLDLGLARAAAALRMALAERRAALERRTQAIALCNPKAVLGRGYSITRDAKTGQIIRSTQQVRPAQRVRTELADGDFASTTDGPRQQTLFDEVG